MCFRYRPRRFVAYFPLKVKTEGVGFTLEKNSRKVKSIPQGDMAWAVGEERLKVGVLLVECCGHVLPPNGGDGWRAVL